MSYEYYSQYLDITPEEYATCEEIASTYARIGLGNNLEWLLMHVSHNKRSLSDRLPNWFNRNHFRLEIPKVSEDEFLKYLLQSAARYW